MYMPKPRWLFGGGATNSPQQNLMIVISSVLGTVILLTALAADLAVLRVMDRMISVVVVATLLTVGLLLPEHAEDGPVGRRMWIVGTVAAWVWMSIALIEYFRRYWGDLMSGFLGNWEGSLRLSHVLLAGVTAALSTFIGRHPSHDWAASTRRAVVAVAVTTVLVLPSGHFNELPWQTRTNDAVHTAAATIWLAGLLGVLYIGFVRISAVVRTEGSGNAEKVRVRRPRTFRSGDVTPPDPAFANLKHAANRFSDLVGLPVSLVVVVSGVAMILGVAQYVGGDVFFQDFPWGWGWMAMWKVALTAIALACAAVHRTVTMKTLNGDPIDGVGAIITGLGARHAGGLDPTKRATRPQAVAFQRLAVVEVAVLLFAGVLGTSMNLAGIPQASPSTAPAVVIEFPGPGGVHSPLIARGTANLQPDSQMWLIVEDLAAGEPYYLATDAPVAVDSNGHWESRVTLGTGQGDVDQQFRLTAIVVADRYFDEAIGARPAGQYSVRLLEYPGDVQASVDVVVDSFGG